MKNLLCVLLTLLISQRAVAQDYTIPDVSSDSETLAISPDSSSIRFNVTGRTYSLNGRLTTPVKDNSAGADGSPQVTVSILDLILSF